MSRSRPIPLPTPPAIRSALLATVLFCAPSQAHAQSRPDSGTLVLHMEMNPIGAEHYSITERDGARTLTTTFAFSDRGAFDSTLVTLRTLAKGRLDTFDFRHVQPRGTGLHLGVGPQPLSSTAFAINGYAPMAVQQELVRYWELHGRPDTIPLLPHGSATITYGGRETLGTGARKITLSRYTIGGVVWGAETVWLDSAMRLVGAVTNEAGGNHFEVVREGYEALLPVFVAEAARANMARLVRMASHANAPSTLALVGATLIDGSGAPPVHDAIVVVSGGRITAAGPRASVTIPRGATRIDVAGKYIIPGLWDMHAHYSQVEWGPAYLAAGVTTARDVGNEFEFIRAVRDVIAEGRGVGPRILVAGFLDGDSPNAIGVRRASNAERAVALVREYKAAGFQQVKIYQSVPPALVPVITAEAHRLGMTVTGHVPTGMTVYDAVNAGMDMINHVSFLGPMFGMMTPPPRPTPILPITTETDSAKRAIQFLLDHHTVIDATLAIRELFTRPASVPIGTFEPGFATLPPQLAAALDGSGASVADTARLGAVFRMQTAIVSALHRAGVPIVAGTDQIIPGHSLHRELELYVQCGFTPLEALQSATRVPARVMGLERESGTVAVGKRADLVVLDADPLADVSNVRRVRLVIANGRQYDPDAMARAAGFGRLAR